MGNLPSQLLPIFELLKLAGDTKEFQGWYLEQYKKQPYTQLFHGYKYFIEGCLHIIFDATAEEEFAGMKNDIQLNRAIAQWIPIKKFNITCNKTIFLRNVYHKIKTVLKSKDFEELEITVKEFNQSVVSPFQNLFQQNAVLKTNSPVSNDEMLHLLVLSKLYLYFNQIKGGSPVAHISFLAGTIPSTSEKYKNAFEGYKYCLQFVWYKVLGKKKYRPSCLANLHTADSWKTYIYGEPEISGEIDMLLLSKEYELAKQTCLDSYFDRIKEEIIRPAERKYSSDISFLDGYWDFSSKATDKKYFSNLLNKDESGINICEMNDADKIEESLFWLPLEVVDASSGSSHNGVAAFNTMLAGTVALFRKSSEYKKCHVAKFKHSQPDTGSTYSYAILVDTKSAADHYHSGWLIYYDCCNDYSGFSSSQYRSAEKLIAKYLQEGKLEIRELEIDLKSFTNFVSHYLPKAANGHIITPEEMEKKLNEIKLEHRQTWSDIKGLIIEWLAYYFYANKYQDGKIKWNIDKQVGEIDVFVETKDENKLIECKYQPNNYNMKIECKKLLSKVKEKSKKADKNFKAEFWFWDSPSLQNEKILAEHNIKFIVLNNNVKPTLFQNFDFSRLTAIMSSSFD